MPHKKTQVEVIADFKEIHGDRYDYSDMVYKNTNTKVAVICSVHGMFEITPGHHKKGTGCAKCTYDSQKITRQKFINESKSHHNDAYDYSLVPDNITVSSDEVILRCKLHDFPFKQLASNHMKGHTSCLQCRARDPEVSKSEFIARSKEVHGDTYDYSQFEYNGWNQKSKFICHKHGVFEQTLSNHINSKGCSKCSSKNKYKDSFKNICEERGVNYDRALKRRQADMSEDKIFKEDSVRGERETTRITVAGVTYPNLQEAVRVLNPTASITTITRWLSEGISPDEAFGRVPNPGYAAGIIYLITHQASGKKYIGQTVQTLENRLAKHQQDAMTGTIQSEGSLHAAIREHGIEAFSKKIIERGITKISLGQKERDCIEKYGTLIPNGYNILKGGESGGSAKKPIEIDGKFFESHSAAAEYYAKKHGISLSAAKKRISKGRPDVKKPAKKGQSKVKTKAYKAWSHIVHVATNPKSKDYIDGLTVCDRWKNSNLFIEDNGHPTDQKSVFTRIDRFKGFYPENCEWRIGRHIEKNPKINSMNIRD